METLETLNPQFVTDADGRRTAVLLDIEAFERLMGDIASLTDAPSEQEWLCAASRSSVFEDLADPAQDVYSANDGVPFQP